MQNKKYIILIVIIFLMMIGLSLAKTSRPESIDWTPSFINTKTDPYGTYITYNLLEDIFEKNNIRSTRRPIYNNLKNSVDDYLGTNESYQNSDNSSNSYSSSKRYDIDDSDFDDALNDSLIVLIKAGDKLAAIIMYKEYTGADLIESRQYIDNLAEQVVQNYDCEDITDASDPSAWYRDMTALRDTTAYIFINTSFSVDKLDLEYLLDFVGLGNDVFISAESFSKNFTDSLSLNIKRIHNDSDTIFSFAQFPEKKYSFGNIYSQTKISIGAKNRLSVQALGFNNQKDTVFVDVQYGKGHFYLHTIPSAFANINVLQKDKYDFAFGSLSYLPKRSKIIWDEYQKQGMIGEDSMFRVIFNETSLRTAFYLILLGLLLFMIFRAKREQRAIPVIKPPINSSVEFLNTISNLYYRKKDFEDIVEKRQSYFLDFVRKNYYLSTENVNDEFMTNLSAKSGLERDKLNELFVLYKDIKTNADVSNHLFLKYNNLLEEFYKKAKSK